MKRLLLILLILVTQIANARTPRRRLASDLDQRLSKIEQSIDRMEGELEILKAQSRLVIRRTTVSYLNAWYLKGNLSILLPRRSSFTGTTDTGIGAHIGLGKYLGRNHVLDLTLDWDLYPAVTFRYRIEMHNSQPAVSVGPVIGVKQRILNKGPFDNFFGDPSEVKPTFFLVGGFIGIPMSKAVLTAELAGLINSQFIITATAGVHFFL